MRRPTATESDEDEEAGRDEAMTPSTTTFKSRGRQEQKGIFGRLWGAIGGVP